MANNVLKEELVLNSNQFDKNINNVIKKVEELKGKGAKVGGGFNDSMSTMIERATGFNGSMGSLIGVVGKFGGALGVAMGAGEIFNKMMTESQTIGDAVVKVQNQAGEAVNYFASSMASADFGGFLSGLADIIRLAGDAADAMDRAASIGLRFGWTSQSQLSKYNKAMAEARNPENSKEERKRHLEEAKKISSEIAKNENLKSKADVDAAFKTIRTELAKVKYNGKRVNVDKLTDNDIRNLFDVANFERFENVHKAMKEALDGVVLTNTRYGKNGAHLAKADQKKFSSNNMALAAYAANEINDNEDSPLGKALQMIGAVDQMLSNQAEREAQTGKLAKKIEGSTTKITKNTVKTNKVNNNNNYAVGSVGYLEQLISELQKKIKLQVDATEIKKLQDEIKQAKNQLDSLLNPLFKFEKMDVKVLDPLKPSKGESLKDKVKTIDFSSIQKDLPTQYKEAQDKISNILDLNDMGLIGGKKAKELIDGINQQLQSKGLRPIKVPIETDAQRLFYDIEDNANAIVGGFQGIDNVVKDITALSTAISDGANAWQMFMGVLQTGISVIQTVSSVLNALNTLQEIFGATSLVAAEQNAAAGATEIATAASVTAAKGGEAIAGATASGAKMPFPFNLIAIATGVAAVVTALATISGAFANGGIVGGNSYSGDATLIRANSGEMVLTTHQQKNLFDLLDRGATGNANGGNVNFVIRGKDLHGVLHNYDDKMNKIR